MTQNIQIRVGVLGAGSVGAQTARLLLERADELEARVGARLSLAGIAVRNLAAQRDVEFDAELLTTDAEALIDQSDVLIELIGGIEPARTYIRRALSRGAAVVTANKALIAQHGEELFALADEHHTQLFFEASVAAAIPILRPLQESLTGDRVTRVLGIVNGSTNYILDRMDRFGDSAESAAATALELGYLEADPTLDVEGFDAASKVAILARLAFHSPVPAEAVYREGMSHITLEQVVAARESGFVVKLLGIAERLVDAQGRESISARVYPALIPREHPLATVHGGKNAVFVEAEAAGSLMFYGAGAGGVETASAVLGDVVSAARRRVVGGPGLAQAASATLPTASIDQALTQYHITLDVWDQPGVLATVASVLAQHEVSVETVRQSVWEHPAEYDQPQRHATLVLGTHRAKESALASTLTDLAALECVVAVQSVLRIEGN